MHGGIWCRKSEEKRRLLRRKIRWENNINVAIKGIEWEGGPLVYLCGSAQKHLTGCCKHCNEPHIFMKFKLFY
jgi:hypothetical protein